MERSSSAGARPAQGRGGARPAPCARALRRAPRLDGRPGALVRALGELDDALKYSRRSAPARNAPSEARHPFARRTRAVHRDAGRCPRRWRRPYCSVFPAAASCPRGKCTLTLHRALARRERQPLHARVRLAPPDGMEWNGAAASQVLRSHQHGDGAGPPGTTSLFRFSASVVPEEPSRSAVRTIFGHRHNKGLEDPVEPVRRVVELRAATPERRGARRRGSPALQQYQLRGGATEKRWRLQAGRAQPGMPTPADGSAAGSVVANAPGAECPKGRSTVSNQAT